MTSTKTVAEYVRINVNWNSFFSLIYTIGNSLNGRKDRFDKSDLIEKGLSKFSNGTIQYVNTNGVDHILTDLDNTTQEMKFSANNMFYGLRTTQHKTKFHNGIKSVEKLNKPLTIKLFNSMGENKHVCLPASYAKYLLVVDNYSAGVVKVEDIDPYIICGGDGISAVKVPCELFEIVVKPGDYCKIDTSSLVDYKQVKNKYQEEYINQFI